MEKLGKELRASEEVGIKDEQLEITCVEKYLMRVRSLRKKFKW